MNKTIRLSRKHHVLYIGNNSKDIDGMNNIILLYNVSHVIYRDNSWCEIYNGDIILGFITNVENIEERW